MLTPCPASLPGDAQRDQTELIIIFLPSCPCASDFGRWPLHPAHLPSQTSWMSSSFSPPHTQWWSGSASCILESPGSTPSSPPDAIAKDQVFIYLFFGPLKTFLTDLSASYPVLFQLSFCFAARGILKYKSESITPLLLGPLCLSPPSRLQQGIHRAR